MLQWRRFILVTVLTVTVAAAIVSFLIPKTYRATASLLPPKDQTSTNPLGAASSLLRGLGSAGSRLGVGQNRGSYNYLAVLNSRTAKEAVVRRFNLAQVYEISDSSIEKAVKQLESNMTVDFQPDDYITVDVEDHDPQRAADMVNYFVEVLNNISINLGTQEARNNRVFIEKRLATINVELRAAEDSLRTYQERTGTMITPEQAAAFSSIAALYVMKERKDVELAVLRRTMSADDPAVRQAEIEVHELSRKIDTIPETGLHSLRLYRDVLIRQKIVEFLVPLYEQAKIDEQKDVPVILVLDKAVPPERKAKPQRTLIVAGAAISSLLLSLLLIFLRERFSRMAVMDPEQEGKLEAIKGELRKMFARNR